MVMIVWRRFIQFVILPLLIIEIGAGAYVGVQYVLARIDHLLAIPPPFGTILVLVLEAETVAPIAMAVVHSPSLGTHTLTNRDGESTLAVGRYAAAGAVVVEVSKAGYFADAPDQIYAVAQTWVTHGEQAILLLTLHPASMRSPMNLEAHAWDDEAHRTAIHTAFDLWLVGYMNKDWRQEIRWRKTFADLIAAAKARHRTYLVQQAVAELERV